MTLGTGFFGRSSIGENLEPRAPRQLDPGRVQRRSGEVRSATSPGSSRWTLPRRCPLPARLEPARPAYRHAGRPGRLRAAVSGELSDGD